MESTNTNRKEANMNTTTTITLTDREAETLRHALRLFAEGPYSRRAGSKPGYEADYSKDEYEIYFRKAVESLREKAEEAR